MINPRNNWKGIENEQQKDDEECGNNHDPSIGTALIFGLGVRLGECLSGGIITPRGGGRETGGPESEDEDVGKIVMGDDVRGFVAFKDGNPGLLLGSGSLTKGERVIGGGGVCRCIFMLGLLILMGLLCTGTG